MEMVYTKERMKEKIKSSKVFHYLLLNSSAERGKNRTVIVFAVAKGGRLLPIAEGHYSSAAWRGSKAEAVRGIAEIFGYKTDGYDFIRRDIQLHEIETGY